MRFVKDFVGCASIMGISMDLASETTVIGGSVFWFTEPDNRSGLYGNDLRYLERCSTPDRGLAAIDGSVLRPLGQCGRM